MLQYSAEEMQAHYSSKSKASLQSIAIVFLALGASGTNYRTARITASNFVINSMHDTQILSASLAET